ncbi:hypothetical protein [Moorella sulfitireducens (nom. illeg.)]|uniref:hypothetical protein n=1 Tax=Neomoorella sulfitireducens TaxID=2972948 RepID=UPI0021AD21E0|nr:hypothetical protein [Moorella sulfitireducens]
MKDINNLLDIIIKEINNIDMLIVQADDISYNQKSTTQEINKAIESLAHLAENIQELALKI